MEILYRELAGDIVESLGSTGTPPEYGVSHYSAGLDRYLDVITEEYLKTLLVAGHSAFRLVIAHNGDGKTHFLRLVQETGWSLGYIVSMCNLVPGGEASFASMDSIYRVVASNLRAPLPAGMNVVNPPQGIEVLLEAWLSRLGEMDPADSKKELTELRWGVEGKHLIDNPSYRKAVCSFAEISLDNRRTYNRHLLDRLVAYLRGQKTDMKEMRIHFSITERISASSAFRMLRALCQFVRVAGFQGLIMLVDEVEQDTFPSHHASKAKFRNVFKNLLLTVNEFGQGGIPHCLLLYAVTNVLARDAVTLGPAFQGRVLPFKLESFEGQGSENIVNWSSPRSYVEKLDIGETEWMSLVGEKICGIYQRYRGEIPNWDIMLRDLVRDTLPRPGYRREFMKALIARLDSGVVQDARG